MFFLLISIYKQPPPISHPWEKIYVCVGGGLHYNSSLQVIQEVDAYI